MAIPYVLDAAHLLADRAIRRGDLTIDATVGNGHDTLFLARSVGPEGRVVGFDIQQGALNETRRRVQADAPDTALHLIHAGHETMATHLAENAYGTVSAVMFNLGYLPGGDHSVTTTPETTCPALDTSVELLRPGGIITVVAYTGHEGGEEEAHAVESWASALPEASFRTLSYRFVNQPSDPPRHLIRQTGSDRSFCTAMRISPPASQWRRGGADRWVGLRTDTRAFETMRRAGPTPTIQRRGLPPPHPRARCRPRP